MIGIYGANGFIGRHLTVRLARAGRPVKAVSRRFDREFCRNLPSNVECVETDISHSIQIVSSLREVDTVVDLIGTSSPALGNSHMVSDITENVIPHIQLLEECVRSGVQRFIFISSGGSVYGSTSSTQASESTPTRPISSHGLTKLTVEKYIQMFGAVYGLEYAILRLTNPYGPGQEFRRNQGLIPAVLYYWKRGMPVTIFGDGNASRDYIFIEDAIDAIEATIGSRERLGDIINIGSGETRTVLDVIRDIERIKQITIEKRFVAARSTDVSSVRLDTTLAKSRLKWWPKTSFEDGIAKTLASFSLF
ncbi:MAG: NAD-dependent epimerase/dehydratase family protein [Pseudonocardiaceae bacterium]|nr:MAG: NAD-dependent epimerase/dehydratase family protein [Pseudonocardiaceae bacterium]